jgi:hypothetical protein
MKTLLLAALFLTGFAVEPPSLSSPIDDPALTVAHEKTDGGKKKKKDDEEKEEDVACVLRAHFTS